MEIGNYYWIKQRDCDATWLIKYVGDDGNGICGPCLRINNKEFFRNEGRWGNKNLIEDFRLATTQEMNWLRDCIDARKYVEPSIDIIINNYQIY